MYVLKCFDKWERVMAHAVERASADIADRVVIRALAKLQLQQHVPEQFFTQKFPHHPTLFLQLCL
jgi:hypothetical protein